MYEASEKILLLRAATSANVKGNVRHNYIDTRTRQPSSTRCSPGTAAAHACHVNAASSHDGCSRSWRASFACSCRLKKHPAPAPAATRNRNSRPSGKPHSSLAVTTGAACSTRGSAANSSGTGGLHGRMSDFTDQVTEGMAPPYLCPKCTASGTRSPSSSSACTRRRSTWVRPCRSRS